MNDLRLLARWCLLVVLEGLLAFALAWFEFSPVAPGPVLWYVTDHHGLHAMDAAILALMALVPVAVFGAFRGG